MAIYEVDIPGLTGDVSQEELQFLATTKAIILDNLHNPLFGSLELAVALNLSTSQLSRRFAQLTHYTPAKMIRHFRMEYALVLLQETDFPVGRVAELTGFREQANFTRTFKRQFGLIPTEKRGKIIGTTDEFTYEFKLPLSNESIHQISILLRRYPWFESMLMCIIKNIHDESFTVEALADSQQTNMLALNKMVRKLLNISVSKLIRILRVQYASELVISGKWSLGEIAYQAGFFDHPHFSRSFKAHFFCTPKEFKSHYGANPQPQIVSQFIEMTKSDK